MTRRFSELAAKHALHAVPKLVLNTSIGENLLDDNLLHSLLPTANDPLIKVLAAVNIADNSIEVTLEQAAIDLMDDETKHVMFPLGPGHWYWVSISKTGNKDIPYAVEVFDPFNGDTSGIHRFLSAPLQQQGFESYERRSARIVHPQQDHYSCGYYVAAFAHAKVKHINSDAHYNQAVIDTLEKCGNHQHQLRNTFIKEYSNKTTPEINKEEILKSVSNPAFKELLESLFALRTQIESAAAQIKDASNDEELAIVLQAEEFSSLKR